MKTREQIERAIEELLDRYKNPQDIPEYVRGQISMLEWVLSDEDIDYNIGDKVLVDDEFICTVVDICSDSGSLYYEVKCDEFNTFNRHVKVDQIKEVK
jgi:hypothetical protein